MGGFAGWLMPLWYSGAVAEHDAVRDSAGLFDVSHLSKFEITGDRALAFVQSVTTNDAGRLDVGEAQYTLICNESGGILDDVVLYRLADRYWLVGNAGTMARTYRWLAAHVVPQSAVANLTHDLALLALQGPAAAKLLEAALGGSLERIPRFHGLSGTIQGVRVFAVRSGYTGEDGFELFCASGDGPALWRALTPQSGRGVPVPSGLAARDILRLEAGLRLYGQDIDDTTNPLEAGLGWAVSYDKGDFIGREALLRFRSDGLERTLVGLVIKGRFRVPRKGCAVIFRGSRVGRVTSGAYSPSLRRMIALAYVPVSLARPGNEVELDIRGQMTVAQVVRLPFYHRPP